MTLQALIPLLQHLAQPRILLFGDVMLDRYVWGDVEQISPEAPIPILRIEREEHRLGGAGGVAAMLSALEAAVTLISVIGGDPEASTIRGLLDGCGVDQTGVASWDGRPTTLKTRFIGRAQTIHPQQMLRTDRETREPLAAELDEKLFHFVEKQLLQADVVLVSDYGKGVCAGDALPQMVALAREAGVPVLVDPARRADYRRYAGCACLTPNRVEASAATGLTIRSAEDGLDAACKLLEFGIDAVLVKLDKDGMAWACRDGRRELFPVRPRNVYDITGAGDMVLSVLGYCLALGADYPEAIQLANLAAGLEVERFGATPITRRELLAEVLRSYAGSSQKVVTVEELEPDLQARRTAGQQIVMTNGCFDLLHPGHVSSLRYAREQGHCLVVGLNSDASVRALKGPGRPVIDEYGRAETLAALACVDYVVVFEEVSVAPLVERIRPDVLVKSALYTEDGVVGRDIVEGAGGRVVLAPAHSTYSTTGLIERIAHAQTPSALAGKDGQLLASG